MITNVYAAIRERFTVQVQQPSQCRDYAGTGGMKSTGLRGQGTKLESSADFFEAVEGTQHTTFLPRSRPGIARLKGQTIFTVHR